MNNSLRMPVEVVHLKDFQEVWVVFISTKCICRRTKPTPAPHILVYRLVLIIEKGILTGPVRFMRQLPWKAGGMLCWNWINISLSGERCQWFPQGNSHPEQEKALEFHGRGLRCLVPWELIEGETEWNVFSGPNQYRDLKWRGVYCQRGSPWAGRYNEQGSEVTGEVEVNSWRASSDERWSGWD